MSVSLLGARSVFSMEPSLCRNLGLPLPWGHPHHRVLLPRHQADQSPVHHSPNSTAETGLEFSNEKSLK